MTTQPTLFDAPPVMERYHNTTGMEGEQLRKREIKTGTQNWKILCFFRLRPSMSFTPYDVWRGMRNPDVPVTSIRRGMTDLTALGYIRKTDEKREGQYGELTYCWRLNA